MHTVYYIVNGSNNSYLLKVQTHYYRLCFFIILCFIAAIKWAQLFSFTGYLKKKKQPVVPSSKVNICNNSNVSIMYYL